MCMPTPSKERAILIAQCRARRQDEALKAGEAGDSNALSHALDNGAKLTPSLASIARRKPSVEMCRTLNWYGWPFDRDLASAMAEDIEHCFNFVLWYVDRGAKYTDTIYTTTALKSDLETLQFLRHDYKVSFAGTGTLAAASWAGNKDMVDWLLEEGEERIHAWPLKRIVLDGESAEECIDAPPLHCAIQKGHVEIVETLLQNGADPLADDRNGICAWQLGMSVPRQKFQAINNLLDNYFWQ